MDLLRLGEVARSVREAAGLTQAEAARRIGSSQPNVSAAERGQDSRYASVAISIIETFGRRRVVRPLYGLSDILPGSDPPGADVPGEDGG